MPCSKQKASCTSSRTTVAISSAFGIGLETIHPFLVHMSLHTEPAAKMPFHNMSHTDPPTAALKSYRKDRVCF